jgi:lysophospholipase L1-like esterase
VVVCFGINDIIQGDGPALCDNLETIVSALKAQGKQVILQSIPPFDFEKQPRIDLWESCNRHIRQVLAPKCDGFLDVSTFLSVDGAGQTTKYGGHPSGEGCSVWAEHLLPVLRRILEESV